MLSRAWNYAKRHPWKVVLGGAAAAAAAVVGGTLAARIWNEHKRLAALLDGEGDIDEVVLEQLGLSKDALALLRVQQRHVSESEWRAAIHFVRNQVVADRTVQLMQQQLLQEVEQHFAVETHTRALRDPAVSCGLTPQQKQQRFLEMAVHVVGRTCCCCFLLQMLLLLHRVQVNLLAADLFAHSSGSADANSASDMVKDNDHHLQNFAFLSSTKHATSPQFVARVASACLAESRAFLERCLPQRPITAAQLREEMALLFRRVDDRLRAEATRRLKSDERPDGAAAEGGEGVGHAGFLLPENASTPENAPPGAAAATARVQRLLEEARDVLDSPAFEAACCALQAEAADALVERVLAALGEAGVLGSSRDGNGDSGGQERGVEESTQDFMHVSFPLARCLGRICRLAEWALGSGGGAPLLQVLAATPQIQQLSAVCYWPPETDLSRVQQLLDLIERAQQSGVSGERLGSVQSHAGAFQISPKSNSPQTPQTDGEASWTSNLVS